MRCFILYIILMKQSFEVDIYMIPSKSRENYKIYIKKF